MAKPTNVPNSEGNFRGMLPQQREALARGREMRRSKKGYIRPKQVGKLQGEASIAISGRLRRFIDAYDDDPDVLSKVAVGQLLADLWDANSFLRPIWVTVRRLAKRINTADRKGGGKPSGNGDGLDADIKILRMLDGLVPLMDQLGRWHKRTTDVALRLAELSVRLRTAQGGNDYIERTYGAGAISQTADDPPAHEAEDAEVLEEADGEPGPEADEDPGELSS